MKIARDELIKLLESLVEAVRTGDTLEGQLSWSAELDHSYEVNGTYRLGNNTGWGGTLVLEEKKNSFSTLAAAFAHYLAEQAVPVTEANRITFYAGAFAALIVIMEHHDDCVSISADRVDLLRKELWAIPNVLDEVRRS